MPGANGIFDVIVNGKLIFSKDREGRFPTASELTDDLRRYLSQ
jgi:selT/selW/selH-like putative selenoprotein